MCEPTYTSCAFEPANFVEIQSGCNAADIWIASRQNFESVQARGLNHNAGSITTAFEPEFQMRILPSFNPG